MERSDAEFVVTHMKKKLMKNIKITPESIDLYHYALENFSIKVVDTAVQHACLEHGDKHGIPSANTIKLICEGLTSGQDRVDPREKQRFEQAKSDYKERKDAHRIEVVDFIKRITRGHELKDYQEKAFSIISRYIVPRFGERSPKEELLATDTPFSMSYIGLYMDYLDGRLKELSGEPQGDMLKSFAVGGKKAYDEEHFKKEKVRERSLNAEKQRELGI